MQDAKTIALRLAAAHPDNLLLCPVCASEVKGANLEKHIGKVHADVILTSTIRGSDGVIWLWALLFAVVTLAASLAALAALGLLGLTSRLWAGGVLLVFGAVSVPVALAFAGKFPARIEVDATGLTLFRTWGTRRVAYPVQIETGQMLERHESGMAKDGHGYYGPAQDRRAGSYMRFVDANSVGVTVGAKSSTHPLKYWSFDHAQGKRRRVWDVDLEPAELAQLQYLLSEHGVFEAL